MTPSTPTRTDASAAGARPPDAATPPEVTPPEAPAVRIHDVAVDVLRLHVRDVGDPAAPVVVMLHGIMGHAREWDPVVEALARHGRRVLAVDQRGHGRSDHADTYAAEPMSADVIGVLDALEVGRADLVGHSMGGMIGLVLAAAHPARVGHLALLDVVPDVVTPETAVGLASWIAELGDQRYTDVDDAVSAWLAGDPFASRPHLQRYVEPCLRADDDGRLRWCFDAARLGGFVTKGVSAAQLWTAAERLARPPLLVRGEHSPFVTPAAADEFAARIGATVVTIADAAHDLGVEQPEAVIDALVEHWAPLRR